MASETQHNRYLITSLTLTAAWMLGMYGCSFLWIPVLIGALLFFCESHTPKQTKDERNTKGQTTLQHQAPEDGQTTLQHQAPEVGQTTLQHQAPEVGEYSEWLNCIINQWWVFNVPLLSKLVKQELNLTLNSTPKPDFLESISIQHFTMGNKAPSIKNIRLVEFPDARLAQTSACNPDNSPPAGPQSTTLNRLVLQAEMDLKSELLEMGFQCRLGGTSVNEDIHITAENFCITGTLQLVLYLGMDTLCPRVAKVTVYFLEKPDMSFSFKMVDEHIMNAPLLKTWLHHLVADNLVSALVDPRKIELNPHAEQPLELPNIKEIGEEIILSTSSYNQQEMTNKSAADVVRPESTVLDTTGEDSSIVSPAREVGNEESNNLQNIAIQTLENIKEYGNEPFKKKDQSVQCRVDMETQFDKECDEVIEQIKEGENSVLFSVESNMDSDSSNKLPVSSDKESDSPSRRSLGNGSAPESPGRCLLNNNLELASPSAVSKQIPSNDMGSQSPRRQSLNSDGSVCSSNRSITCIPEENEVQQIQDLVTYQSSPTRKFPPNDPMKKLSCNKLENDVSETENISVLGQSHVDVNSPRNTPLHSTPVPSENISRKLFDCNSNVNGNLKTKLFLPQTPNNECSNDSLLIKNSKYTDGDRVKVVRPSFRHTSRSRSVEDVPQRTETEMNEFHSNIYPVKKPWYDTLRPSNIRRSLRLRKTSSELNVSKSYSLPRSIHGLTCTTTNMFRGIQGTVLGARGLTVHHGDLYCKVRLDRRNPYKQSQKPNPGKEIGKTSTVKACAEPDFNFDFDVDRGLGIHEDAVLIFDLKNVRKEHIATKGISFKSLFRDSKNVTAWLPLENNIELHITVSHGNTSSMLKLHKTKGPLKLFR